MKKMNLIDSKAKQITALFDLFRAGYLSDTVYVIKKRLNEDSLDIVLWMSDYDYRTLLILANGSGVSVFEVESNTLRHRKSGEFPEDTADYKYIVLS